MQSTNTYANVGGIDERGMLRNLLRKGFSMFLCLSELFANSIDACASTILYSITRESIRMIDDGTGMNMLAITNMWDMNKENHSGQKTLGVSGVGGKAAMAILSNQQPVIMYTRNLGGQYYAVIIPWDVMYSQGKYVEMIIIRDMTPCEIVNFHKERENMKNKDSGTTICFTYNDELKTEIENQFVHPTLDDIDVEYQLSYIYGGFGCNVYYMHYELSNPIQLINFNYFGAENNAFYKGKTISEIHVYENKEGKLRYILPTDDGYLEFKPFVNGKRCKTEPTTSPTEPSFGWTYIGCLEVTVGCRIDDLYFNETSTTNPTEHTNEIGNNNDIPLRYEQNYFGNGKNGNCLYLNQLARNGQVICGFDFIEIKNTNRRANAEQMFKIRHMHCRVSFNPDSNQDNKLDILCGITENKNVCSGPSHSNLLRLIRYIKDRKSTEVLSYFKTVSERNKALNMHTISPSRNEISAVAIHTAERDDAVVAPIQEAVAIHTAERDDAVVAPIQEAAAIHTAERDDAVVASIQEAAQIQLDEKYKQDLIQLDEKYKQDLIQLDEKYKQDRIQLNY